MLRGFLALLFIGMACGSGSGDAIDPSTCEPRTGQYREHWTTESGDCGDISDTVLDTTSGPDPDCAGSIIPQNQCGTFEWKQTCTTATATTTFAGNVTWPVGTRSGSAHFGVVETLADGETCNGIYSIQFTPF